jgi:hypothetical protein
MIDKKLGRKWPMFIFAGISNELFMIKLRSDGGWRHLPFNSFTQHLKFIHAKDTLVFDLSGRTRKTTARH